MERRTVRTGPHTMRAHYLDYIESVLVRVQRVVGATMRGQGDRPSVCGAYDASWRLRQT